jgi:molecular chaperone HscB
MSARREMLKNCERLLDHEGDYQQAAQQVRSLMFVERFAHDIETRLDRMDTADKRQ